MNDTTPPPANRRPRLHGRVEQVAPERCAAPGCAEVGEFRAPASNKLAGSIGGWRYLCLDHVRAFNSTYNYFDGMSPDDIAAAQSPLAGWAHVTTGANGFTFNDPLGAVETRFGRDLGQPRSGPNGARLTDADITALKLLGLEPAASFADIRRAYKALVRRFHPDTNGGDRRHERRLQDVVQAYTHLRSAPAFAPKEP